MAFDTEQPAYQNLRSLIKERINPVVPWVGAGLSASAGLPLWPSLRDHLRDVAAKKLNTMSGDDLAGDKGKLQAAGETNDL